jgi:hypothetical protein
MARRPTGGPRQIYRPPRYRVAYAVSAVDYERRRSPGMNYEVYYGGLTHVVKGTPQNRETILEIGRYVREGKSEQFSFETDEGTLFLVVGPTIPLAASVID